jgi:hypothetical protein
MVSTGLLDLHSAIRYIILIFLFSSLFTAYSGLIGSRSYTDGIHKWHLSTRILVNIQALIGLALYFLYGFYHAWTNSVLAANAMFGFFAFAHIIGMIIGVALINIGHQKALNAENDYAKYKHIAIFYSIGILIIFLMIPWPFFHSWAAWF